MSTAWFQHCSALTLSLFFQWSPALPWMPPKAEPPAVAVEAAVPSEPEATTDAPEEPVVLPGVVIEEITKGSTLEKAGLQIGDVILSWELLPNPLTNPEGASGKIESPFDWMWLKIEQAPRGMVRLRGERGGAPLSYEIPAGEWAAEVTPNFVPLLASWFRHGELLKTKGEVSSAIAEWNSIASWLIQHAHAGKVDAWLNIKLGQELAAQGDQTEAKLRYLRALDQAPDPLTKSLTLDLAAQFFFKNGDISEAETSFRLALELRLATNLGELSIAKNMDNLATALYYLDRKNEVDSYLRTAHEIYSKIAPQTREGINILSNLGKRARELGDLEQSIVYRKKAVEIAELVCPNSTKHADSLHELGVAERDAGLTTEGRDHLSQALALREQLEPNSTNLASTLNSLALLHRMQGDLDQALVLARRSVNLSERLTGAEVFTAASLNSIALIENALGQWPEAEIDLARALKLAPKSDKGNQVIPTLIANMAMVQENQGNLAAALPLYREALELKRRKGLTTELAPTLRSLGILHYRIGKSEEAQAYLREALSIQQKTQPGSPETADTLDVLASILAESGKPAAAREYLEDALQIIKTAAPNSLVAAQIYSNYGVIQKRLGSLAVARQHLQKAMDIYDRILPRASRSHAALSSFSARNHHTYLNAFEVYVVSGEKESALEIAERARGRALRIQISERDLISSSDIPAQVAERIKNLERSLDKIGIMDSGTSKNDRSAINLGEHRQHSDLLRERENILAELRRRSPRLATLRYPQALSANEIRSSLDQGTVLVSFLVGNSHSYLLAFDRDNNVFIKLLPIRENDLRQRVKKFRSLIAEARPGTTLGEWRREELRRISIELYNLLIAPAADLVERANRVLIVADGPLHYLPFAALMREAPSESGYSHDQYLAEWKPFHSVLSATVYAEIKKDRQDPTEPKMDKSILLGAFGDPQFPPGLAGKAPEQIADLRIRSAVRRGILQFEPLPFTRREVEAIAALFPPEQVAVFLGTEATEERAKIISKGARILHFATHARLDDQFPLDSSLVLTLPEGFPDDRDNGLLQVWEIFERMRLDADLVVLSACETGLGEEQGGEGLIGLTRAFQYAGARTVMASLWSVQDQATSELMIRFYKHLRAGLPKDEALRQAQAELIRGPIEVVNEKGEKILLDASAPYFWAGFQVYGDWQ